MIEQDGAVAIQGLKLRLLFLSVFDRDFERLSPEMYLIQSAGFAQIFVRQALS